MTHPDLLSALAIGLAAQEDSWGPDKLHVTDLSVALAGDDASCARQLWLRLHGAPQRPRTPGEMLMFDNSHSIHERVIPLLQTGLVGTGWRLEHVELSLKGLLPEGVESGRMDAVLRHDETKRVLVYDTKTVRGKAFQYLKEPKPAHVLQVQTYAMAFDADGGVLLYLDREGQNAALMFYIQRDDATVLAAVKRTREIVDGEQPPILAPKVNVRENKGPDSVYLDEPWQCAYCTMRGTSCPGALPKQLQELGIVAKRAKDGTLSPSLDTDAGRDAFKVVLDLLGTKPSQLGQVLFGG